jgi:hypothetical protein
MSLNVCPASQVDIALMESMTKISYVMLGTFAILELQKKMISINFALLGSFACRVKHYLRNVKEENSLIRVRNQLMIAQNANKDFTALKEAHKCLNVLEAITALWVLQVLIHVL